MVASCRRTSRSAITEKTACENQVYHGNPVSAFIRYGPVGSAKRMAYAALRGFPKTTINDRELRQNVAGCREQPKTLPPKSRWPKWPKRWERLAVEREMNVARQERIKAIRSVR
jgi:hypothetical protein